MYRSLKKTLYLATAAALLPGGLFLYIVHVIAE
jgi:hypothetical protein